MSTPTFDLLVLSGSGEPHAAADLSSAMVLDLEFFPACEHKPHLAPGRVTLPVVEQPFAACVALPVPGFGDVYLYADNEGRGYRAADVAGRTLNFALEAAASRAHAVARSEARYQEHGFKPSSDYAARLAAAQNLLADARAKVGEDVACAKLALASLAESLHAGEMLVVEFARQRIARSPSRPRFRFGCNGFAYPRQGEPYAKLFRELLNFVTLPFYRRMTEPHEGHRDFSQAEKIAAWAARDGLAAKGHPLIWENLSGRPDWLRGRTFEQVCAAHRDYIRDAVTRFRDRIHVWDVINEAHDWANDAHFSPDQMVALTRLGAEATQEADPRAVRVVNSCCTWSEYAARGECSSGALGRPARNVLRYLREVLAARVPFEVVGIQMYYPYRDLFEIDRHLEMFCRLGKPIHITELGVSSAETPRNRKEDIKMPIRRWHGRPWSEAEQADWVEGYYTLCYAKPEIEAITWWCFSEPAWYPHGALVDADLRPKEAYHRLQKLIQGWR